MASIRLSVVKPRPGHEERAVELLKALSAAAVDSPGWQPTMSSGHATTAARLHESPYNHPTA